MSVLQLLYADANKDAKAYLTYANQAQQEGHEAVAQLLAALARSQEVLAENSQLLMAAFDQEAGDASSGDVVLHGTKNDLDLTVNVALAGRRKTLFAVFGDGPAGRQRRGDCGGPAGMEGQGRSSRLGQVGAGIAGPVGQPDRRPVLGLWGMRGDCVEYAAHGLHDLLG